MTVGPTPTSSATNESGINRETVRGAIISATGLKEFDITGRPMTGWVMVAPEGIENVQDLRSWVRQAAKFSGSLPAKKK